MTPWIATMPEALAAVGLARHRAGRLAPRAGGPIGGHQGMAMFTTFGDVPTTRPRWLLELSP
jgi:hypothetical protein